MSKKRDERPGGSRRDDHGPRRAPSSRPGERRPGPARPSSGFSPRRDDDRSGPPRGPRREGSGPNERPFSPRKPFGDGPPRPGAGPRRPFGASRPEGDRPARPTGGQRKPYGSKPGFDAGDRRPDDRRPGGFRRDNDQRPDDRRPGERRTGGDREERRPYGDKPAFGPKPSFRRDGDRPTGGERRLYGDKPAFDRKPGFNPNGPARFGNRRDDDRRPDERRPGSDRPEGGERRPYGNKPAFGPKPGFNRDGDSRGNDRRGGDRPVDNERGERRFGDKKPFTPGSRPTFDKPRFEGGDRRGNDRPYGDKPFRKFGDKPAFGGPRPTGDDRPRPSFRRDESRPEGPAPGGVRKPLFKSRSHRDEPDGRTPNYDFNHFKENAPKRIQKRIEEEEGNRSDTIRLNRYIANAGVCSRRDADKLIESGEVMVNGKAVTEMGFQVKPGDVVKYGSRTLNPEKMLYVLLNKPKDFITTTDDPNDRRTVMDLVKNAGPQRIYPVGRLDRNTTGLLLLTNDGELAEKLTHPSYEIRKMYQAELDKPITTEDFEKIKAGLELEDGFIKPDDLAIVTPDAQVVGIEIHSGRNRIVRRLFETLGYEVTKLDRTVYASLDKKDLPRGNWRFLTEKEVIKLKYF